MGFGLIPETLEEFSRQFGDERVHDAVSACQVSAPHPSRPMSDDERKRLFNYLIGGAPRSTTPAIEASAPESTPQPSPVPPPGSERSVPPSALQKSGRGMPSHAGEMQILKDRLRALTEQNSRLLLEIERRARALAPAFAAAAEKRARVAIEDAQERDRSVELAQFRLEQAERRASQTERLFQALESRNTALLEEKKNLQAELSALKDHAAERRRLLEQISDLEEQMSSLKARLKEARSARIDAEAKAATAESQLTSEQRQRHAAEQKLAHAQSRIEQFETEQAKSRDSDEAIVPWSSSPRILKWMGDRPGRSKFRVPSPVVLSGSRPLDAETIEALLCNHGASISRAGDPKASALIVGHNDWYVDDIEEQIKARSGSALYIFSQEMFLTALMVGADPFVTADKRTLLDFAESHEALRFCIEEGFLWPSIPTARIARRLVSPPEQVGESPLHRMGYQVGRYEGVEERERRDILERAFHGKLPFVESEQYMSHWGPPGSRRRLRRMATLINWHIGGARGRTHKLRHDMSVAIRDWSSDMNWMREQLYEPWMHFRWPQTHVEPGSGPSAVRRKRVGTAPRTPHSDSPAASSRPNYRGALRFK